MTYRCQRHAALLEAFFDEREQVIVGASRLRRRDAGFDRVFSEAERRVQGAGVPSMFRLRPALRDLQAGGEVPELIAPMIRAADRANAAVLAYLDRPEWVSPDEVGWSGSFAAAALVVHADDLPDDRPMAIERMRAGIASGAVDPRRFAHLVDRDAAMHGRDQIYGTLFVPVDGTPQSVWPMPPEEATDEARRTIGLPPLCDDRRSYDDGAKPGPFLIPSTRSEALVRNARLAASYLRHGRSTRHMFHPACFRSG